MGKVQIKGDFAKAVKWGSRQGERASGSSSRNCARWWKEQISNLKSVLQVPGKAKLNLNRRSSIRCRREMKPVPIEQFSCSRQNLEVEKTIYSSKSSELRQTTDFSIYKFNWIDMIFFADVLLKSLIWVTLPKCIRLWRLLFIFIYQKSLISVLWVFKIRDVSVYLACT